MLGKILLTLAIIAIAVYFLRRRRQLALKAPVAPASPAPSGISDARLAAWMFLALMAAASIFFAYSRWQDSSGELTVILHRDGSSEPVVYSVHRRDFSQRTFTTTDGVRVTVSANERMEVIGL